MGIPHATVVQMDAEGITTVDDLADFDKDSLQQLADNLRRPGGRVADPNPNADPGATIPTPSFVFGAKSQKRLSVACDLVRYYQTVGRDLTAANIQWNQVMRNFEIQWKALKTKKDEDPPDVPKITKSLPIIKWTEAFQDFLNRVIGVRVTPLYYVIRTEADVPAAVPPLAPNQPHSIEHGSVEAELVARASHTHALFRDDNASVYHHSEEATRATVYAASIKPYQRAKNGRGAWQALIGQYAGIDKWEAEIKKQEQLMHTRIWKGQTNFSLEAFISQHRNAFVSMQACAEHVEYQLPNQHSRVGYLLENIQCSDAGLQAAMASVKTDNGPGGMRNQFELAAAHLLPYDPVAKKRAAAAGSKRGSSLISGVDAEADVAALGGKQGFGKTGVPLRWHKQDEYVKLSKAQKDELREYQRAHPDLIKRPGKGQKKHKEKRFSKKISSLVTKHVQFALDKANEEKKDEQAVDDAEAFVMSVFNKAVAQQSNANAPSVSAASGVAVSPKTTYDPNALKAIIQRAKNGSQKK